MVGVASLLSVCATVASVLLFISPMKDVQKAKSLKSTRGQSALPFVFMWLNCCLWGLYGLQVRLLVILVVNGIGAVLSTYYFIVFLEVSKGPERVQLALALLGAGGFVAWAALYSQHYVGPYVDTNFLPWIATTVCVLMFASPLVVVGKVLRDKDASFLNFRLSVMGVINCIAWTGLGIIYRDLFVLVPNFLGLILSLLQVALFVKYPAKPTSSVGDTLPI